MADPMGRAVLEIASETGQYFADLAKVKGGALDLSVAFGKASASITKGMVETGQSMDLLARRVGAVATMAGEFSGAKIARDADEVAAAVGRVGGASKLTASEQQRVNQIVTEAIAKYKQLGQEAPAHLTDLANATKQVEEKTSFVQTKMVALGAAIGTFAGNLASQALSNLGQEMGVFIQRGAQLPAIEGSFRRLAAGLRQNADEMVTAMQGATRSLVSDFDLMQSANKAMLLGLPVTTSTMGDLARTATILGKAMGQDATKSLDDLITALGRSSPMILDNLGLTVKVGEANDAYAAKLGKTAEQLTEAEKKTAFYEAAMEAARRKTEELGEQTQTLGEILESAWTRFGNVVTREASDINIGLGAALSSWKNFAIFSAEAAQFGAQKAIEFAALRQQALVKESDSLKSSAQQVREWVAEWRAAKAGGEMVAQLAAARENVAALSSAQRANVAAMIEMGLQYKDLPKSIKLSAVEFDLLKGDLQKSAEAGKQAAAEAKKHADALAEVVAGNEFVSDTTYAVIVALAKQGQSESDIAKALYLRGVQVKQVMDAEKIAAENAKFLTDQRVKDAAAVQKIMDDAIKRADALAKVTVANLKIESGARKEAADIQARLSMSAYDFEKYQIRQWGEEQKKAVDTTTGNWKAAYAAIDELVRQKLIAIVSHQTNAAGEMGKAPKKIAEDWRSALDDLSKEFVQLAQVSGTSWGDVAQGIGASVVAINGVYTAMARLNDDGVGFSAKNLAALSAGWVGVAVAVAQVSVALASHLQKAHQIANAIKDVGKEIGVGISNGLATGIAASAEALKKLDSQLTSATARHYAELLALDQIIGATGGLTNANLVKWTTQAERLFEVVKRGGELGAKAAAELVTVIGLFAKQADATGGVWSETFKKLLADTKALGVGVDAINQLMAGQQSKLVAGAVGVTSAIGKQATAYLELKKAVDDATNEGNEGKILLAQTKLAAAVVTTQDEFDRLSRIELGAFNTLVASGVDSVTAMGQVGSGIDDLIRNAEAFGLSGNAAFETLSRWRDLTTTNAPLLTQIGNLNDLMVASANLGSLTADGFADLEAQGVSAYEQLTKAGLTQQEAETAMKPLLESIIKLHEDKGYAIDDETQKLIEQARQDGVITDEKLSTNDILMEGFSAIIKAVGGDIPDAFKKFSKAGKDAAADVTDALSKVPTNFDFKVGVSRAGDDTGGPSVDGPGFAQGTKGQYLNFGRGTPTILHGWERVMTANEGAAEARITRQPSGPTTITVISQLDGREVARNQVRYTADAWRERGF